MKSIVICCCVGIAIVGAASSPPQSAVWRPTERWRGFNLQDGNWRKGWIEYDENDFAFMKEFGFNFARLPLSYRRWLSDQEDWESIDPSKLAFLDRAIALGEKYGVHIMVNLHRAPGYTVAGGRRESESLWTSDNARRVFLKHWRFLAERYRDVPPERLSFNPVNEPPCTELTDEAYAGLMRECVKVIREVTPARFVVCDAMGSDRHPCAALYDDAGVGQATRGYYPEAVSQWHPPAEATSAATPALWPRDGLAPAGVLAGPGKPEFREPLVLGVYGPGRLVIAPGRVSANCTLVARDGGREISRLRLEPKAGEADWSDCKYFEQWKMSQGTYRGKWVIEIPEGGRHDIAITCDEGDWVDLRQIGYSNPDKSKRLTLGFYHLFARPRNFRQLMGGWDGPARAFFPLDSLGHWSKATYRDPGKEYLYRHVVKAWEEPIRKGVFAFCGEMGPENFTPHNVQLALLEDYLQLWKSLGMGWAIWQLRGETGVLDSNRKDVDYENWRGHLLDREMLDLLRRY